MAATSGVKVVLDRTVEVAKAIELLATTRVMVGVPASEALRKPDDEERRSPINNAALAYIHENGAPEVGIPPRPFLKPALREHKDEITRGLKIAGQLALDGKGAEKVLKQLKVVGIRAVSAVKMKIRTGPFVPLKPRTIAARRRRSKGSKYRRKATGASDVTPLIDTAQMLNAINFVIRKVARK